MLKVTLYTLYTFYTLSTAKHNAAATRSLVVSQSEKRKRNYLYPSILFYPFHLRSISVAHSLLSADCCPLSSKTKLRHCQPPPHHRIPPYSYKEYLRGILVWWRTEVLTSRPELHCFAFATPELRNHELTNKAKPAQPIINKYETKRDKMRQNGTKRNKTRQNGKVRNSMFVSLQNQTVVCVCG